MASGKFGPNKFDEKYGGLLAVLVTVVPLAVGLTIMYEANKSHEIKKNERIIKAIRYVAKGVNTSGITFAEAFHRGDGISHAPTPDSYYSVDSVKRDSDRLIKNAKAGEYDGSITYDAAGLPKDNVNAPYQSEYNKQIIKDIRYVAKGINASGMKLGGSSSGPDIYYMNPSTVLVGDDHSDPGTYYSADAVKRDSAQLILDTKTNQFSRCIAYNAAGIPIDNVNNHDTKPHPVDSIQKDTVKAAKKASIHFQKRSTHSALPKRTSLSSFVKNRAMQSVPT